ncbi:MAG: LacI family DNA-binding transcriptional regulator [Actinomycetaceae bacterium]|nr:LacI family DNA-binding transcriptional regulator [Actinomycetaceae bacterium]
MGRLTIRDIAQKAGVSPTAVSFALNDRPGISADTRRRVREIADQLGWMPNANARSLSLARAGAIGLYIAREPSSYNTERFFFNFLVGLQETLARDGYDVLFHTGAGEEAEIRTYRKWWRERRIAGVVLLDPVAADPRVRAVRDANIPAVVVGARAAGLSSIDAGEARMVRTLAEHLRKQGAQSLGYVCGLKSLLHTKERAQALREYAQTYGLDLVVQGGEDVTEAAGRAAVFEIFRQESVEGLIFDNETLTFGGIAALQTLGLQPGREVLVCSCEDSPICRIASPSITVIDRDPADLGALAATLVLERAAGGRARIAYLPEGDLVVRASTAGR